MLIELNAKTGGIIALIILLSGSALFYQFYYNQGKDFIFLSGEFLSGSILGISLSLIILILASPEGIEPIRRAVTFLVVVLAALLMLYTAMVYLI